MAIGCWEKFTGTNWERYSNVFGGITSFLVIFFAIMTWIFKYNAGVGAYTFFIGFFVMFFETPVVSWIGPLGNCRDFCNKVLFMEHPAVRGIVYIAVSILMFMYKTPCIAAGICLLITSILKFFAQCNVAADAEDNKEQLNSNLTSNQA